MLSGGAGIRTFLFEVGVDEARDGSADLSQPHPLLGLRIRHEDDHLARYRPPNGCISAEVVSEVFYARRHKELEAESGTSLVLSLTTNTRDRS